MLIRASAGEEHVSLYVDRVFAVQAFRVYYDAIAVHAAPLYTAVTKALDDFRIAEGCSVAPTLIPVSGASFTLKIRELVLFDVTAASTHLQT